MPRVTPPGYNFTPGQGYGNESPGYNLPPGTPQIPPNLSQYGVGQMPMPWNPNYGQPMGPMGGYNPYMQTQPITPGYQPGVPQQFQTYGTMNPFNIPGYAQWVQQHMQQNYPNWDYSSPYSMTNPVSSPQYQPPQSQPPQMPSPQNMGGDMVNTQIPQFTQIGTGMFPKPQQTKQKQQSMGQKPRVLAGNKMGGGTARLK